MPVLAGASTSIRTSRSRTASALRTCSLRRVLTTIDRRRKARRHGEEVSTFMVGGAETGLCGGGGPATPVRGTDARGLRITRCTGEGSLRLWMRQFPSSQFLPVRVKATFDRDAGEASEFGPGTISLTTPSGFGFDALDVGDVAVLLEQL